MREIFKKAKGLQKKLMTIAKEPAVIEAVANGVYNYHHKDDVIEQLKNERAKVCGGCEYAVKDDFNEVFDEDKRINGKMCGVCNCSLPYLLRQTKKSCKKNKWE